MSKEYDVTMKTLVDLSPSVWPRYLGLPVDVAMLVDTDESTTIAASDKVLMITKPTPFIFHLEFQSSEDAQVSKRLLSCNALLYARHELPVCTLYSTRAKPRHSRPESPI